MNSPHVSNSPHGSTGASSVPHVAAACGCVLGEGPIWDHRTGTLLWVDVGRPSIWSYRVGAGEAAEYVMPEAVSFVVLTEDPGLFVAGFKSGVKLVDLARKAFTPLVDPEPDIPGNRCNDAVVGRTGVLYFGTQDEAEQNPNGGFFAYDGRELTRFQNGIVVTNGPAISPDGSRLYTVDSVGREVFEHEMQGDWPGPARPFLRFSEDEGVPDGMAIDVEGCLWICHHGGGRITRFTPEGETERVVEMPTKKPTKCAFGGPDLTRLYVTTARKGCEGDRHAGHLFAVETGIRGLPAYPFRGAPVTGASR